MRVLQQAITQVLLMLEVAPGGTAPTGDEAQRVLAFFLSSLKNPTLKRPPTVDTMMSFNTLTPHYEEDVIFALSTADTTSQLGLTGEAAEQVRLIHQQGVMGCGIVQGLIHLAVNTT